MTPLKVLISAYACEPGRGSEPAVGWNIAAEAARRHDVWVLTCPHHREPIEAECASRPMPSLRVVYCDLPGILRGWTPDDWNIQLHYYLWQLAVLPVARRLHDEVHFDVAHHATLVKYWQPTLLSRLDIPLLLGPVAGADGSPPAFRRDLPWKGRVYERLRNAAVWCGERDPLVRDAIRRSALALAATERTATRLRARGARDVQVVGAIGLGAEDRRRLGELGDPPAGAIRFLSCGRLIHWKAFHLGLRAFAAARLRQAEYWIVGDGPARRELERLADTLGIAGQVRFFGALARSNALDKLAGCHVLVHPSLHDSGSYVCLEAMAARRPVICLDLAGPAQIVSDDCGVKVRARDPDDAVQGIAAAMTTLAGDLVLRARMGLAAERRVADRHAWEHKGEQLSRYYEQLASRSGTSASRSLAPPSAPLPCVTVVVPTFDRPHLLRGALDSLLRQRSHGAFRYEILVVDNASTLPGTREAVESLQQSAEPRVRYVREERGGVSHARNRGLQEASGAWVAFFDDDQVAEPEWLHELLATALEHDSPCVGGTIRLVLPDAAPSLGPACRRLLGEQALTGGPSPCTGPNIPSSGNLLLARGVTDRLGPFDTAMTAGGEDSDLVLRIRAAGYRVMAAPSAIVDHLVPPYRTQPRYLSWVARRSGAGRAYTDYKHHGATGATVRCLARLAQSACITAPRLAVARLTGDAGGTADCRSLLWRSAGYALQTTTLLLFRFASPSPFARAVELRRERSLFGRPGETVLGIPGKDSR